MVNFIFYSERKSKILKHHNALTLQGTKTHKCLKQNIVRSPFTSKQNICL